MSSLDARVEQSSASAEEIDFRRKVSSDLYSLFSALHQRCSTFSKV